MRDLFVPYELAVKLKEKGFDMQCFCFYNEEQELCPKSNVKLLSGIERQDLFKDYCLAPMYCQVVDWLREEKGLLLTVDKWANEDKNWCFAITKFHDTNLAEYKEQFNSYYSALQSGIEKALELI